MKSKHAGVGISLGLCFGAALGTALHNLGWSSSAVGVGIALGVSLGAVASSKFVFGAPSDPALAHQKAVSEPPLPHPLGL
jgi:fucose permease